MADEPTVLVLTPVKDAATHLDTYFAGLDGLAYPRDRLSLGFLESDSRDGTHGLIADRLDALRGAYRRVGLWKRDFGYRPPGGPWQRSVQVERRAVLARARNHLLFHALDDEEWVLWLDVDLVAYPPHVLRTLLAAGKDVVHPNCVLDHGGASWDRNAWRDDGTLHLDDLRREGDLVPLDSVGGTLLLVRADVHRDGVIFPPFPYGLANPRIRTGNAWRGEIETEGFGIMAADAGVQCWGMPNLEIRHAKQRPAPATPRAPTPGPAPTEAERYRALLEERVRTLRDETEPDGFHGRGIVVCAGGDLYFPPAWVCISLLRRHGCTLPIELWYRGGREMTDEAVALMARLGVACVDAYPVAREHGCTRLDSWETKAFAIAHSRFREVLYLDADNVPLANPEPLFDAAPYREHGALFWPDRYTGRGTQREWLRREAWSVCGVPYRVEPELESGQILVDRARSWAPLALALHLNEHSDYYYAFFYGDKDTFHLAWRRLGREYGLVPHGLVDLHGVMQQHDLQGRPLFQHRANDKWTISGSNRRIPGFRYEELCRAALAELRAHWTPPMRRFPGSFTPVEAEAYAWATGQGLELAGDGGPRGRIRLLPDFTIDGVLRGGRWMVEEDAGGCAVLSLRRHHDSCFLRRGADGAWRGRWRSYHRPLAELRPAAGAASGRPDAAAAAAVPRGTRGTGDVEIERPVIILGMPRSGTTMLFELLAQSPSVFTVRDESHAFIERIDSLDPVRRGDVSNRLTADDATPAVRATLKARFAGALRDRDGAPPRGAVRMLEKTPRNILRVPFLDAVFPDATFIHLYRDPAATVSSMLDAWRSGRFARTPRLAGWSGPPWSMLLVPGWRRLDGRPLAEVVAAQWATAMAILLDDLQALPPERWCVVDYADVVRDPRAQVARLCRTTGIAWDREVPVPLPVSGSALTPPDPDKIERNRLDLDVAGPIIHPVAERARALAASRAGQAGGQEGGDALRRVRGHVAPRPFAKPVQ
jgi:hypothetical protein